MHELCNTFADSGFGHNNRDNPHIFRDTLARIVNTDPLEYRTLVDGQAA